MTRLVFNNRTPRKFSASMLGGTLVLYAYDFIGADMFGEGVTAKGVAEKIDSAGQFDSITLRINSPGGDLFEGLAIKNLIQSKEVPVTVYVDGEAASAASILALAGDKIVMGQGSMLFIHNALTVAMGNAADLRKTADDLEKVSGEMASMYAKRSGLPVEDIQAMMDKETFLTAEEAVSKHLADAIAETHDAFVTPQEEKVEAVEQPVLSRQLFDHEMALL